MKLYCDLNVNGTVIFTGQVCINLTTICSYSYLSFQGTMRFMDTVSNLDPTSPGLGTQFQLWYIDPTGAAFTIPLQDVYSQQLSIVLYNQNCTLSFYQK